MSNPVITIDAASSLAEAASMMEVNRVKRLPVMSTGKLVGVISRSDIVKALRAAGLKKGNNQRRRRRNKAVYTERTTPSAVDVWVLY